MEYSKIRTILKQSEGPKLDYKELLDLNSEMGKKELAKDVSAIANSQGGRGYLVIGIQDKTKKVLGIKLGDYSEERIQQVLSLRCDPPVTVRVEFLVYQTKNLCLITIFRSYRKPHQMIQTGAFHIRRGSTTDVVRRDELAALFQESGIISNEEIPVFGLSCRVLDKLLIKAYMKKIGLVDSSDDKEVLDDLGFIHYDREFDDYFPTIGGVLLFCKDPQRYLPYLGIRIINKLGKDTEISQIGGNIVTMIKEVDKYLAGLEYDYPMDSLRECIINSILHRDYFDKSREINVYLSSDSVKIINPGSTYGDETLDNLIKSENPKRRNNWIYHKILLYSDIKHLVKPGEGIGTIKESFSGYGTVRFFNQKKRNLFKVLLPGMTIKKSK